MEDAADTPPTSTMRMVCTLADSQLDEDQNNDVEVTWEDQQRINRFSRLNSLLADVEEDLRRQRTEKDELDDLVLELELVDEDERVLCVAANSYRVGETYVTLRHADAVAQLECDTARATSKVDALQSTADACESEMADLKRVLYARFGNNISASPR